MQFLPRFFRAQNKPIKFSRHCNWVTYCRIFANLFLRIKMQIAFSIENGFPIQSKRMAFRWTTNCYDSNNNKHAIWYGNFIILNFHLGRLGFYSISYEIMVSNGIRLLMQTERPIHFKLSIDYIQHNWRTN